jgi:D-beta-D-heptose 7-phosphate kinase/D-beta-D-heptose 1-phosphate adenosyltransferase
MPPKILTLDQLMPIISALQRDGSKIVFTNGCFDLLHAGHVRYLSAARNHGDVLVVGLNSDHSVQLIKGPLKPIIIQNQRAEVLAALACVDYVTIFSEPDPYDLIKALRPDVLVKGADWPEAKIIGADVVKEGGGKLVRISLVPEISTTRIIERIRERF